MGKYVNIMAKVSPECAERIERVRVLGGFSSKYEVVQAAVALMLQYADPGREGDLEADEVARQLQELFGPIEQVRHSMAQVKPNGGRRIHPSEIVAFYGKEALMLQVTDSHGSSRTTSNRRDILEQVLTKTLPSAALSRLKAIRKDGHYPTMMAALLAIIGGEVEVGNDVEEMFDVLADSDPRSVKLGLENKPARAKNKKRFD
jgi:Arc/MetJ-type ribon-helix-helix transcriptional regulator